MTSPFLPTQADSEAARIQLEQIRSQTIQNSPSLSEIIEELLSKLAQGKAVQVLSLEPEITTQQAAEILNVSRPYIVKLVEEGVIPHRKVGPRRRLYLEDVLAYKARLDAKRQKALQALANDLQEMNLE
jgi:excisionase family DNA binding protein